MSLIRFGSLILFANLMTCLGCVTSDEIGDRLQAWVGRDADQLAETWGAPIGTYEKNDGGKILTYSNSRLVIVPSDTSQRVFTNVCRIVVRIGPSGLVESFNWQGSVAECDNLSLSPPIAEPIPVDDRELPTTTLKPLPSHPLQRSRLHRRMVVQLVRGDRNFDGDGAILRILSAYSLSREPRAHSKNEVRCKAFCVHSADHITGG